MYINEIIRVTYKCNWKCKFCNVYKTNNYGVSDISKEEIINSILFLAKKYTTEERKNLTLSFSGGEPLFNKSIINYIKLAKKIGVGNIQIQTNGTVLYENLDFVNELINAGLNELFIAQHGFEQEINKKQGSYFSQEKFEQWVSFLNKEKLYTKLQISLNIVVNKINIYSIKNYLNYLDKICFLNLLDNDEDSKQISFGLVQPNGYANINKNEVLLKFNEKERECIKEIIAFCQDKKIIPDFHYTAPPLCILNIPEYNLEYIRLKELKEDILKGGQTKANLESYKKLWKEKEKLPNCINCRNNEYCLGFYKNWIEFIGKEDLEKMIETFILGQTK